MTDQPTPETCPLIDYHQHRPDPCSVCGWTPAPSTPEPSPEERFTAAHRALTDALHEFYRTATDGGALLVDWVLVTAGHADLGDGTSITTHHIFGPEGGAAYRSLGLLEYGSNFVKDALTAGTTTDP